VIIEDANTRPRLKRVAALQLVKSSQL